MQSVTSSGPRPTLKAMLEDYERRIIEEALRVSHGNQRRAARALGVLPTTLHEKMKRLGLKEPGADPSSSRDASAASRESSVLVA